MRHRTLAWTLALVGALAGSVDARADLSEIRLPAGFRIAKFADVPGARSLAMSPDGTVFVGSRGSRVFALRDDDHDLTAESVTTIASGLASPNGVAFRDGALYVAEISRVTRYPGIEGRLGNPPAAELVSADFPSETHHGAKFIAFGPDGKLYVPVGAPCNVCVPSARHAALFRMNPDGTGKEVFARGIRNTVGFDWHPETDELWFTDNGRDNMGNNVPPDELNHAPRAGLDFGFPVCHGQGIVDPTHGTADACQGKAPPALDFDAHIASLGMRFYTGTQFPSRFRGAIFVAEHGSWNRTPANGYRITLVTFGAGGRPSREVFASGWLRPDGDVTGRPVDVLQYPDGSLLVSDDSAGAVYRISYAP